MSDDEVVPMAPSIARRAANALLNLDRLVEKDRSEEETRAITTARDRATATTLRLRGLQDRRTALVSLGLSVAPLAPTRRKSAGDARTALRSAASALTKVGSDVTSRLNGPGVQNALKQGEELAAVLESALIASANAERLRLRPDGLDDALPNVPGKYSLNARLERLRHRLNVSVSSADLPTIQETIETIRQARSDWDQLRPGLDAAIGVLPLAVQRFLSAAHNDEGAPWALITDEVRAWLDEGDNARSLRMRAL